MGGTSRLTGETVFTGDDDGRAAVRLAAHVLSNAAVDAAWNDDAPTAWRRYIAASNGGCDAAAAGWYHATAINATVACVCKHRNDWLDYDSRCTEHPSRSAALLG